MGKLTLGVLGTPQIIHDGQRLSFPTRKALGLLLYLAVEGGMHSREKIATYLWSGSASAGSRAALRTTLSRLRATLGDTHESPNPPHLLFEPDSLGFNFSSDFELDFRGLRLASAASRGVGADTASLGVTLQAAVDSYRGEFLEGFTLDAAPEFDAWIDLQRQTCHTWLGTIYERLCTLYSETGDSDRTILTATNWVTQQPFEETAHYWLMKALFARGDRAGALRAYDACCTMLTSTLATEPAPQTLALAEQIRMTAPLPAAFYRRPASDILPIHKGYGAIQAPMVGREQEYGALVLAYRIAQRDGLQIVSIEGEAGIGKTRLATEFVNWAAAQGADVIEGHTFEIGGRLPYQALVEGLRPRLEHENAPDDLLSDVWLAELSRLLPELRERYSDLPLPLSSGEEEARLRLFESVAQLGESLAKRAPLVVCIDDLQWSDTASLDLLRYVARRWTENLNPILIILTVRLEALRTDPSLAHWLIGLGRDASLKRLTLEGLTAAATQQLIESLAAERRDVHMDRFSAWLFQETAGQPFFIMESLKALLERDVLHTSARKDGTLALDFGALQQRAADLHSFIPSTIRDLIQSRLARLSKSGMTLLAAASVLGHDFIFEDLCQVADLSEAEGLFALDEVLTNGLLRQSSKAAYNFAHDKIRDVVYTEAGAPRRRLLHRRAVQALQLSATSVELAHHALEAAMYIPAFRFSLAAGAEAVQLYALEDGIAHYQRAILALKAQPGKDPVSAFESIKPTEIAQLYAQLGRALELSNRPDEAETTYNEMFTQVEEHPALACIALHRLAMMALQAHNDMEAAQIFLQRAIHLAEASQDKATLAETEWNIAQLGYYNADTARSLTHGQRALVLARELASPELTARSLNVIAYAHLNLNENREAEGYASEAYTLFASLGNRAMEADCLSLQGDACIRLGRTQQGIGALRTSLSITQQLRNAWGQANCANKLALALLECGDYQEALHYAQQGRETARGMNNPGWHVLTLSGIGAVYRALFDLDAARRIFAEAQAISRRMPTGAFFVGLLATHNAITCGMAGAWEEAGEYALQAQSLQHFDLLYTGLTRWYEIEALLRGGHLEEAEVRLALYQARSRFNPRYRIWYLCALASYNRRHNRREEITPFLEEAAALCEQLNLPGEQFEVQLTLSAIYNSRAEHALTQAASEHARAVVDRLAGRIDDAALRKAFQEAAGQRLSEQIETD